jgi:hypothetical protein
MPIFAALLQLTLPQPSFFGAAAATFALCPRKADLGGRFSEAFRQPYCTTCFTVFDALLSKFASPA